MTPEQWRRVRERFDARVGGAGEAELGAGGADPEVERAVERLVAAHRRSGDFLAVPAAAGGEDEAADPPERIGSYRLLRELGRGGMGVVYLAERADELFEKRVAIKLIDARSRSLLFRRHFEGERAVLARLDHPYVTRLLDAGVLVDGRPYIVMEHVDGVPATAHVREGRLSTQHRLELFVKICRAVEYAHRHLVVHCDLKPANVLVTGDGVPKVADFGVARLLGTAPDAAQERGGAIARPLTPRYASPQLLAGEPPSTGADVYSLGVLLDDLLAAEPPVRLPRPLARIVETARAEEPDRRYASVADLREEVERFTSHRPVRAVARAPLYRLGLLVRRQWLAVGVAALAAALLAPLGWQAWSQHQRLQREERRLGSISRYLIDIFERSDRAVGQKGAVTALELLDAQSRRGLAELDESPEIRSDLLATLGRLYLGLGAADRALDHLRRAEALRAEHGLPPSAQLDAALAEALVALGDYRAGGALAETVLGRAADGGLDPGLAADVHATLVTVRLAEGRFEDALEVARAGVARANASDSVESRVRALAASSFAAMANSSNQEAERDARRAMELVAAADGMPPSLEARVEGLLGGAHGARGEWAEAERLLRRAIRRYETAYPDGHPDLRFPLDNLAWVHQNQGRYGEAEALYRRALALSGELLGESHPQVTLHLGNLSTMLSILGRWEEAAVQGEKLVEVFERTWGPLHPYTVVHLHNYAFLEYNRGRLDSALALERRAVDLADASGRVTGEYRAAIEYCLALILRDLGDLDAAEPLLLSSERWRREMLGPDHPRVGQNLAARALLEQRRGDLREAAHLYDEALVVFDAAPGGEHRWVAEALVDRASLALELGDPEAALADAARSAAVRRRVLPPDHPDTAESVTLLARSLRAAGVEVAPGASLEELCAEALPSALAGAPEVCSPD